MINFHSCFVVDNYWNGDEWARSNIFNNESIVNIDLHGGIFKHWLLITWFVNIDKRILRVIDNCWYLTIGSFILSLSEIDYSWKSKKDKWKDKCFLNIDKIPIRSHEWIPVSSLKINNTNKGESNYPHYSEIKHLSNRKVSSPYIVSVIDLLIEFRLGIIVWEVSWKVTDDLSKLKVKKGSYYAVYCVPFVYFKESF